MTPVREALEFLDGLAENAASDKREPLNSIIIGNGAKLIADKLRAAPGEPCAAADLSAAWAKYVAVFGEEPHGTEKQMGALLALVTTPQPAAGWDEAISAVINLLAKYPNRDLPAHMLAEEVEALRRETPAPAPAEGVNEPDIAELSDAELLKYCGADAMRWAQAFCAFKKKCEWGAEHIDEGLMLGWFANAIETALTARPDTAEARLREAVEDAIDTLESMDLHVDNPLYERLVKALSTPSGGDEALLIVDKLP